MFTGWMTFHSVIFSWVFWIGWTKYRDGIELIPIFAHVSIYIFYKILLEKWIRYVDSIY